MVVTNRKVYKENWPFQNMSLEKTIAEIEVLVSELDFRVNSASEPMTNKWDHDAFCNFYQALAGIGQDVSLVYKKYSEATKALKRRRKCETSVYLGELAMDCKNLADNLNIFMQTTYGEYADNLKSLEVNTQSAPKTQDGKTLFQVFIQTHDFSKESLGKKCRDSKGHGAGHLILQDYGPSPGYVLKFNSPSKLGAMNVQAFLDSQAQSYLEMTKTILQTIADNDMEHFGERKNNRKLKIDLQRARNFYHRHSRPVAIALASVLLTAGAVGGVLGNMAYENYQRQQYFGEQIKKMNMVFDRKEKFQQNFDEWESCYFDGMEREIIENRRTELQGLLIGHPEYAPSYDLEKVFGANSNLFESTRGGLEIKSARLGVYVDKYISNAHIDPINVTGKAREFLDRRQTYRENLQSFSISTRGKVPTPAALETLDKLFHEEKALFDLEGNIAEGFPHGRLK